MWQHPISFQRTVSARRRGGSLTPHMEKAMCPCFRYGVPNQVERYQERFYDAVSARHRDVVNEIGPPL